VQAAEQPPQPPSPPPSLAVTSPTQTPATSATATDATGAPPLTPVSSPPVLSQTQEPGRRHLEGGNGGRAEEGDSGAEDREGLVTEVAELQTQLHHLRVITRYMTLVNDSVALTSAAMC
jgi:hypothetical protein